MRGNGANWSKGGSIGEGRCCMERARGRANPGVQVCDLPGLKIKIWSVCAPSLNATDSSVSSLPQIGIEWNYVWFFLSSACGVAQVLQFCGCSWIAGCDVVWWGAKRKGGRPEHVEFQRGVVRWGQAPGKDKEETHDEAQA